jgi:rod shape determining protein RodA
VYSVLAEEWGFIGVLVTLALYLFVLMRSLDASDLARDRVGAFLVVGIISGFAFQVLYNITMSAAWPPSKG